MFHGMACLKIQMMRNTYKLHGHDRKNQNQLFVFGEIPAKAFQRGKYKWLGEL